MGFSVIVKNIGASLYEDIRCLHIKDVNRLLFNRFLFLKSETILKSPKQFAFLWDMLSAIIACLADAAAI